MSNLSLARFGFFTALATIATLGGLACMGGLIAPGEQSLLSTSHDRIIYSSLRPDNWDIFYFATPGAPAKRLTEDPGLDYDAVFSPDGRWVVFTTERNGNPDLYVLDLRQGGKPRKLVEGSAMEDQAAISHDGSMLVFMSTQDGNANLFSLPFEPEKTTPIEKASRLTRHPAGEFRPAISPDGRRIAFSSDRDTEPYGHPGFSFTRQREGDIYLMDVDGGNVRRLTDAPSWDGSPEWSADGRTLYFYSARPRTARQLSHPKTPILGQEGGFRIWAMDADGSNPRAITPVGLEALSPALTPDGRIAFQHRTGVQRWKIRSLPVGDVSGSGVESAMRLESDDASDYWNPDYHLAGAGLVCHGLGPVDVEDSAAVEAILGRGGLLAPGYPLEVEIPGRETALYPMRHTTGLAPHPSENQVAVTVESETGTRLVIADIRGYNQRELFPIEGIGIVSGTRDRVFDLKWSADGSLINFTLGYFFGSHRNSADLWIMNADGTNRVNLTQSDTNDGVGAFSPDGKKIVFRSAREGVFDLYLMNIDGSDQRKLTDDPARDNFPVFSPQGDKIAYSSDRDGATGPLGYKSFDNYVMDLSADGTPGEVRRISDAAGHDSHPWFSPDGSWIAYTSEKGGISDEEPLVQEVLFAPQMYGEIYVYRLSDGLTLRLTHNKWEEGNPVWGLPAAGASVGAGRVD